MRKNFELEQFQPDFFDESKNRKIEIASRFLEDKSYYLYKGFLVRKGREFIYLENGEIFKVVGDKEEKIKEFKKIAINKSIISSVEFGD